MLIALFPQQYNVAQILPVSHQASPIARAQFQHQAHSPD
jgi:hypothetical protein